MQHKIKTFINATLLGLKQVHVYLLKQGGYILFWPASYFKINQRVFIYYFRALDDAVKKRSMTGDPSICYFIEHQPSVKFHNEN